MENDIDVVEELRIKNRELYINKLIIDLEKAMESLLLFYCKKSDELEEELTYCDIVAQDAIIKISSFLDNPNDYNQKEFVEKIVSQFFSSFKEKINEIIEKRLAIIKNNIRNIDTFNYEKKLNSESLIIVNEISDYYQENVYILIDAVKDSIQNHLLDLKDYLLNGLYIKLMNTMKDKLIYYIKLINNNYDENTSMLQTINEKTLK